MENRRATLIALGICTRCRKRAPLPGQRRCAVCVAQSKEEYQRKRARMTPEQVAEYNRRANARGKAPEVLSRRRQYAQEARQEVIAAYGGACACCGEGRYAFLMLHHPKDDGAAHRRALMNGKDVAGSAFAYKVWKLGCPPGLLRVLCANCHHAVTHHGVCPHKSPSP